MATHRHWKLGISLFSTVFFVGCGGSGDGSGSTGGGSPPPPLPPAFSLKLDPVGSTFSSPVFMTAVPGDNTRLFVVEQGGRIQIFDLATKTVKATPFLDLSNPNQISSGGEQGLLGLVFDPKYSQNRQFYVFYTDLNGDIVVARYLRDPNNQDLAVPNSGIPILMVPHQSATGFTNHNGGMLAFGPDECLYVGIGDGGGGGSGKQRSEHKSASRQNSTN